MKLTFPLVSIVLLVLVACAPGAAAAAPLEEGGVLPDGQRFSPVFFGAPLEGPVIRVDFPGLSKVKVTLRESDGVEGQAKGKKIATSKKQSDETTFTELEAGSYDILVQQGSSKVFADDIVVTDSPVIVDWLYTTLNVDYDALTNVRADLRLDDGNPGSVGKGVWSAKKQQGSASYPVLLGSYDVRLKLGAAQLVVDGVDCSSGPCSASDIATDLSIDYDTLENMRVDLRVADGADETVGGGVWTKRKQSGVQVYRVLRDAYDVRLRHGAATMVIDDVDCQAGPCSVSGIASDLTVDYGGLEKIRLHLRKSDGEPGTFGGAVWTESFQEGTAIYRVLRSTYDARVRQGAASLVIDDIDCTRSECSFGDLSETLTVDYGGLAPLTLQLHGSDGSAGTIGGGVWSKKAQSGVRSYEVLKAIYDLRIRHAAAALVLDDIDCSSGPCEASGITTNLTVDLGDTGNVKVQLRKSDGKPGLVGGGVWSRTRQNGTVVHEVLRGVYDLRLVVGREVSIGDSIDCRSADCSATLGSDGLVSTSGTAVEATPEPTPESAGSRVEPVGAGRPDIVPRVRIPDRIRRTPTPTPTPQPVPPGPVTEVELTVGNGEAHVSWEEPEDHGTTKVSAYRILVAPGAEVMVLPASARELLIGNLENGVEHWIQINAINDTGAGQRVLTDTFTPSASLDLSDVQKDSIFRSDTAQGLSVGAPVSPG